MVTPDPVPAPAGEAPAGPWHIERDPSTGVYSVEKTADGVDGLVLLKSEADAVEVRDALNRVASGAPGRDATGPWEFCHDCGARMMWSDPDANTPSWMCPRCVYYRMVRAENSLAGASRGLPAAPPETFDPRPLGRQLADDIREILDVAAPRFEYTGEELVKRGWRRARTALGEGRPE